MESNFSIVLAILLAMIHLLANRLNFITTVPRSIWLSFGGGISVSYVFLRILPELNKAQQRLASGSSFFSTLEHSIFLMTLLGLVIFYGLEKMAITIKKSCEGKGANTKVFWLHLSSFCIYNILLGYLLHHNSLDTILRMGLFFIAMAAHFLVNDFGFQQTYKRLYVKKGRWMLALSVITGWVIGVFVELGELSLSIILSLVSGGIILNVLKEELPEERESRFASFLLGIVVYSTTLIFI